MGANKYKINNDQHIVAIAAEKIHGDVGATISDIEGVICVCPKSRAEDIVKALKLLDIKKREDAR